MDNEERSPTCALGDRPAGGRCRGSCSEPSLLWPPLAVVPSFTIMATRLLLSEGAASIASSSPSSVCHHVSMN